MISKADKYFKETLMDIHFDGIEVKSPRTKWKDGTPAFYKSILHRTYKYCVSKGEFPITSLRTTPFKGCFSEIEWIYMKQSNNLKDADKSIHSWWENFSNDGSIGKTYGYIVKKYGLMDTLLYELEKNPESRRHILSLWDQETVSLSHKILPPCCYQTHWNIYEKPLSKKKYVDLTLFQRSRDIIVTYSINPLEYVMLGYMVCNHLTFVTGIEHELTNFIHHVNNEHYYDRHQDSLQEIMSKTPLDELIFMKLECEPKNFYEHKFEDFKFFNTKNIIPLKNKLEIAI
ncbi:MAG: hypothetical protein KC589_02445 [Nanoarchaeota archaeon]|nr:hypothetical protein [Nanoarchaeota archaeon]